MKMVEHTVYVSTGALRNPSGCDNGNLGMWIDKHTAEEILKRSEKIVLSYWTEESVLDDTEIKYLRNFIRPFRNNIRVIKKVPITEGNYEYIRIGYKNVLDNYFNDELSYLDLPIFPINTMYTGMELYHQYTLEELGL